MRSVPSSKVTKGEAHRLIDVATKILVATVSHIIHNLHWCLSRPLMVIIYKHHIGRNDLLYKLSSEKLYVA
jgi:hypothetical protein